MTLFTAEKRQFKRERSFKKKRTQLFGNGKDAMSVRNFDDFKRHRYSAVNGTLITTGRTKTAFATKRDKFKVAAVSAAIHGATKRRITAIKHFIYVFNDVITRVLKIKHFFIMFFKNLLYYIHRIIMKHLEEKRKT